MNLNFKRLTSLLSSSLLLAGGLVGISAIPAQANTVPVTFDFEANTVGAGGWSNQFGFSADNNGWANTVNDQPVGSPTNGVKAIKATEGSGAYSGTNVGSVASTATLVDSVAKIASVVFYSPIAGEVLRLKVEQANDPSYSNFVTADATTVQGWQTLYFDFSTPSSGTFNSSINYSLASVSYRPSSSALQPANEAYYIDEVSFNLTRDVFDFEANTVGAGGWSNQFGFSADNNGWANTVNDQPAGSPTNGVKAIKATEGSGAYSGTNVGSVASTSSLIDTYSKVASVVFYSPIAGEVLRLKVEQANDPSYSNFVTADATTVQGWQTLYFDFSTPSSGTFNSSINYSLASVSYRPSSSALQPANEAYYIDQVTFRYVLPTTTQSVTPSQPSQSNSTVNYDVRLASNLKDTTVDAYEWTACGGQSWCVNNSYFMKMVAAGSSTTLSYVVTEHGTTTAVSGAVVRLRINTAYSGSNATWSSGQSTFGPVPSSVAADAGYIEATSNAQGQVSFTFTNTNTSGEAARTLNNANPYPSGCNSPAGQTKGAIEPTINSVSGATVGTQYVDVLWPHVSSTTINSSIAAGSDGSNCSGSSGSSGTSAAPSENKGAYPHIRLDKQFVDVSFDASWWDGVWQYRDADTKAYLKYIPVGSTFKLTYYVTDSKNLPLADAPVSLIVNANYACAKTFFLYENSLIGPDDCSGGGQTELPAKLTDSNGKVEFVLTNTNATGEKMPANLSGLPNGPELGTNIKPHLVGSKAEGIDMLFAHFVEPNEKSKVSAPAEVTLKAGQSHWSTFTFTDEKGNPIVGETVQYYVNGMNSKTGYRVTDRNGSVIVQSNNYGTSEGMQAVAVSLIRSQKLPLTATAIVKWTSSAVQISAVGGKRHIAVKAVNALGQSVKVTVDGKTFTLRPTAESATFKIASTSGKKKVKVAAGKIAKTQVVSVSK